MKLLMIRSALGLLLLLPIWGWAETGENCYPTLPFGAIPVDYEADIQPIFDHHCTSCHRPSGQGYRETGLDLRPQFSWKNLVNITSSQDEDWLLVDPGANGTSLLTQKVHCDDPPVGVRMPKEQPILSEGDIHRIASWIALGATGRESSSEAINFGMTGSWYNPETNGQGFLFDVVIERDPPLLVAYWFTYAQIAGGPETQRWFIAEGKFERGDHQISLDVYLSTGGQFDDETIDTGLVEIGSAKIEFHSCNSASLVYEINMDNDDDSMHLQGEIPLERLSPDVLCRELSES